MYLPTRITYDASILLALIIPMLQMRKLRENEGNRPIQSTSRIEKKNLKDDDHMVRNSLTHNYI